MAKLPVGDQYADQQFLAGFIALRFLQAIPSAALADFQRLDAAVSRPISKSRGNIGKAAPMRRWANRPALTIHYRLAAACPETFYGQLALARTESLAPAASERHAVVPVAAATSRTIP